MEQLAKQFEGKSGEKVFSSSKGVSFDEARVVTGRAFAGVGGSASDPLMDWSLEPINSVNVNPEERIDNKDEGWHLFGGTMSRR